METVKIKGLKSLTVIIGLPIVYILYISSPVGDKLLIQKDFDYYIPFWGGIILLHWISVFIVLKLTHQDGQNLKDLGYKLSKKGTFYLIGIYLLFALLVLVATELVLNHAQIDSSELNNISSLVPKSTSHRIFFILLVFSTGFCEEIVYRGFAITKLKEIGLNKWLAVGIASFLFVGIHGINGYLYRFPFLFIGGVAFGLLFIWRKRLLPSIIVHLIINLSAMMAILELIE